MVVLPAFATRHYPDLAKAQALAEHAVSVDKQTLKRKLVDHASVHWFQVGYYSKRQCMTAVPDGCVSTSTCCIMFSLATPSISLARTSMYSKYT